MTRRHLHSPRQCIKSLRQLFYFHVYNANQNEFRFFSVPISIEQSLYSCFNYLKENLYWLATHKVQV